MSLPIVGQTVIMDSPHEHLWRFGYGLDIKIYNGAEGRYLGPAPDNGEVIVEWFGVNTTVKVNVPQHWIKVRT